MLFLTLDDILESHQFQIDSHGGRQEVPADTKGYVILACWSLQLLSPRPASVVSISTRMLTRWLPPIFTIL